MLKDELQGIISGTGYVTNGASIQAVANYLRKGKEPSANAEKGKFFKEQETAAILEYAQTHHFLLTGINNERYLAEGAEQKVYLNEDGTHVTNSSGFTKRLKNYMQR